jgi:hypothetical protein
MLVRQIVLSAPCKFQLPSLCMVERVCSVTNIPIIRFLLQRTDSIADSIYCDNLNYETVKLKQIEQNRCYIGLAY